MEMPHHSQTCATQAARSGVQFSDFLIQLCCNNWLGDGLLCGSFSRLRVQNCTVSATDS